MKLKKNGIVIFTTFFCFMFFLIKEKKKIINLDRQNINTKKYLKQNLLKK